MTAGPTRVGARTPAAVPPEIRRQLESGELETANFMEQIALNVDALLRSQLPAVGEGPPLAHLPLKLRLRAVGDRLANAIPSSQIINVVSAKSDTIRAAGAMAIGTNPSVGAAERLRLLEPFADDRHFAVREWAWIGLRDELGESLSALVPDLTSWSHDERPTLRRFASEVTRPRGVWTRHLRTFRKEPWRALCLLTPLAHDSNQYVQTSVGNWLNDAGRDHPKWVRAVCDSWLTHVAADKGTAWTCRHGQRSLET